MTGSTHPTVLQDFSIQVAENEGMPPGPDFIGFSPPFAPTRLVTGTLTLALSNDRVHGVSRPCAGRHRAVATERGIAQLWRRLGLRARIPGGGRGVCRHRHPGECLCNRPVLRHGLGVSTRVRRSGRDLLRAIPVPDNAFLRSSGYDWQCDRGYRQDRETCVPIVLPDNAYLTDDTSGSGWACDRGFTARSGACVPIAVPENGYLTNADYGDEWACERGFFEIDGRCDPVRFPRTPIWTRIPTGRDGAASGDLSRSNNTCVAIDLPANAHLDRSGNRWRCDRGFQLSNRGVRSWTIKRPDRTKATPPASGCGSDAG
jgi:hypothetical protein